MKRGMVRSNSVRSRGSSASTPPTPPPPMAPRERLKDCCRQLVAFMCTQVGVGGLVVGYALVGAFGFLTIETQAALEAEEQYMGKSYMNPGDFSDLDEKWWETQGSQAVESLVLHRSGRGPWAVVHQLRRSTAAQLWAVTNTQNVFNESRWRESVGAALRAFQDGITGAVKAGYDGRTVQEAWSFPAALTFSLSVFTMIGYGNLVPRSGWGKLATVVYAVLGIPLYVLYFMNMGRVLASTFRWLYTKMYQCTQDRVGIDDAASSKDGMEGGGGSGSGGGSAVRVIVPSTACLWVLFGYVLVGTIMFAEWEGWNYLDASYFCVTSLCKIGIGDFVPGTGIKKTPLKGDGVEISAENTGEGHTKLVINFVYLLLGMGLIAMCYNLMREEVVVRARDLKARVSRWLESLRMRATECYYGPEDDGSDSEDEEEEERRKRRRRRRRRRQRLQRELREGRGRSLPPTLPQDLIPMEVVDTNDIEAAPPEMLRRSYSTTRY